MHVCMHVRVCVVYVYVFTTYTMYGVFFLQLSTTGTVYYQHQPMVCFKLINNKTSACLTLCILYMLVLLKY